MNWKTIRKVSVAAFGLLVAISLFAAAAGWVWWQRDSLVSRPVNPPSSLVIVDTTVVDVVAGVHLEHVDVSVAGDSITAVTPTSKPTPQGAHVIDGKGKFVVPGLIDMHAHVGGSPAPAWDPGVPRVDLNLEQLLFAGVTRVFDPGGAAPDIFELRESIADGSRLGPTLHAAGPLFTAPGGHPVALIEATAGPLAGFLVDPMTRQVANAEEAMSAVTQLAPMKPDFIKMVVDDIPAGVPKLAPAVPTAIVDAATANGLRTVAHIGTTEDAVAAGRAGASLWVHGVYKEELTPESIGQLAAFQIPMSPTLVVFKSYAELGTAERRSTPLEQQMADPALLASFEKVAEGFEPDPGLRKLVAVLRAQREPALRNARRLHEAGVTILAGSDQQAGQIPGASLHRELALLQAAGIPAIEVLRSTTLYAARFLADAEDPLFGIVAAGKRADLVVVNADPTRDVSALADIDVVILGGVALQRHPRP